jgi:urease alpha subunit
MLKRPFAFRCLTLVASLGLATCFCSDLVAQDVAITNIRIITVTGPAIEFGTIIVRGGKIVSAAAGSASTGGLKIIDGKGMTAMPGYIDAYKHVDRFNKDQAESVLEAGYTTILSGGGTAEDNLKLAQNIDSGVFNGPRIIPSASLPVVAPRLHHGARKRNPGGAHSFGRSCRDPRNGGERHQTHGRNCDGCRRSKARGHCGSQSRLG